MNFVVSLITVCMLTAMSPYRGESTALSGKLIYGQSNTIHSLDLSTLQDRIVYAERNGFGIFNNLSKINEDSLLLEVYTQNTIQELDFSAGTIKKVRSGSAPRYLAYHKKLFYYDRLPDKAQTGLFVVDVSDPVGSVHLVHQGPFFIPRQVTQISRDEVMFQQREGELYKYNIVTGVLSEHSISNCTWLEVMRSATGQLLCLDVPKKRYFLSDLKGEKSDVITDLDGSSAASFYIPEYDVLIFSKARLQLVPPMGEVNDIWAYSFKENKQVRLKKNATVGLGAAIWIK